MLYSYLIKELNILLPIENGLSGDLYGLQVGSELRDRNLHTIVLALDLTRKVIMEAKKHSAHLILTHHGIVHSPIKYFSDDVDVLLRLLHINDIDLYVIHTALDAAKGGVSEALAKTAGLTIIDNFYFNDKGKKKPIGRIGVFDEAIGIMTLGRLAQNLKRNLDLMQIPYHGNPESIVKQVAVVGGKGLSSSMVAEVIKLGCDTFVSGEFTYPEYLAAQRLGLNLIATSHYKSEKIGMESLQKILSLSFPRDQFIFIEEEDPVKYL